MFGNVLQLLLLLVKIYFVFFAKFLNFSHNFWTRNAKCPIKGSKDSNYRLVSTKSISQKIALVIGGEGPITLAKMHKPTPIMISPTKKAKSKTFKFFKLNLEDFLHL